MQDEVTRFIRIHRSGNAPPDTIDWRGSNGYGWSALNINSRYVRGLGLLSHLVVATDIRSGAVDTTVSIHLRLVTSDVEETPSPAILSIESLYPNPFDARRDGALSIDMRAADHGTVRVTIHDMLGRTVAILHDGPLIGEHCTITWSGRTRNGDPLKPGVYFLRALAPASLVTRRFIVRGS
ncbi:MAG: T9SS type A sorting domain-containing protein [Bacteroidota bacterium]